MEIIDGKRSDQVDHYIRISISKGIRRSTEYDQDWTGKQKADEHQENTADAEHGKRSIHDLDGSVFLFFSSVNGEQRRTATSEQIREGRDDHDDGKTKSYCAKCSSSYFGDSCDIDTVNDVIQ